MAQFTGVNKGLFNDSSFLPLAVKAHPVKDYPKAALAMWRIDYGAIDEN